MFTLTCSSVEAQIWLASEWMNCSWTAVDSEELGGAEPIPHRPV